jgi:gamma-glutamylcyclotransferase (GGCT)/AIG2-like uncharacterized protein YtfP
MAMNEPLYLFVYGTLKPGEVNFDRYCATARSAQAAWVQGRLYALPLGYPGLVWGGADRASGVLLTFDDSAGLAAIDELEDYSPDRPPERNEYQRLWLPVFGDPVAGLPIGSAWVYGMTADRVATLGGMAIDGGWSQAIQQKIGQQRGWPIEA